MDESFKALIGEGAITSVECENCLMRSLVSAEEYYGNGDNYFYHCPFCNKVTQYCGILKDIENIKKQYAAFGATLS